MNDLRSSPLGSALNQGAAVTGEQDGGAGCADGRKSVNADVVMTRMLGIVEDLQSSATREVQEVARLREELAARIREAENQARTRADSFTTSNMGRELAWELHRHSGEGLGGRLVAAATSLEEAETQWRKYSAIADRQGAALRSATQAWETKTFKRAKSRPPVSPELWEAAHVLADIEDAAPALRAKFIAERVRGLDPLRGDLAAALKRRAEDLDRTFASGRKSLDRLQADLPLAAKSWHDDAWTKPVTPKANEGAIRLGTFEPRLPAHAAVPPFAALLGFPFDRGLALEAGVEHRQAAIDLARSVVLRTLAVSAPGDTRFIFIDPVSLGQSVAELRHLSEYDQQIVDVKTWTSERDIERRLSEVSDHLEVVISKYLRGQFSSIDEYNLHAGEVAEPYQVIVVFDYPQAFSDRAAAQLLSLVENGPRCGVHAIIVTDPSREAPRDVPLARLVHSMNRVTWKGAAAQLTFAEPLGPVRLDLLPDPAPTITFAADGRATSPAAELLIQVGQKCRQSSNGPVTLDRLLPVLNRQVAMGNSRTVAKLQPGAPALDASDPDTWWSGTTAEGASAPIGRAGAQDVASLYFSSTEVAGGAIVVGVPRSGKSTALHAAIVTLAMTYPPEELELFLVDSKHGVEFKAYDDLPHARMVSIRSEREFSVSVLQSLDRTIAERAEIMKRFTTGSANITEYRRVSGEVMPRIVLFMDEFHEVFEEDDALGQQAFAAFSNIVRQGPFAGVHVVVASQTLSSMPAMGKSTLSLLPMRVAFMCNEIDADFVMGDSNREVRALSQQGSGIFNPLRGDAAHNKPFQGTYVEPQQRTWILKEIRRKSDLVSPGPRPRVFDGDELAQRPEPSSIRWTAHRSPNVPLGEPFGTETTVGVVLGRARGSNVLLLGATEIEDRNPDLSAAGVVHSFLASGARHDMEVTCIDFIGANEPVGEALDVEGVCRVVGAAYRRGRLALAALAVIADEVRRRQAAGDYQATGALVILNGLQRAVDLAPYDPFDSSDNEDEPSEESPATALVTILRDGPDVGVHSVLTVDTLSQLERRIGRDLLSELEHRLAVSSASAADVGTVTDSYKERPPGSRQLLICDHAKGTTRRARSYPPLDESSAAELGKR